MRDSMPDRMQEMIDRRLRYDILKTVSVARDATPDGWISGATVYDMHSPGSPPVNQARDRHHVLNLLNRLLLRELVEMKDLRVYRDENWCLDVSQWRITAKGIDLLGELIAPLADVYDRRPMPA